MELVYTCKDCVLAIPPESLSPTFLFLLSLASSFFSLPSSKMTLLLPQLFPSPPLLGGTVVATEVDPSTLRWPFNL